MTAFRVDRLQFTHEEVKLLASRTDRFTNWPVVYTLDDEARIYVGETLNATARMRQHLASPTKAGLRGVRFIVDETFNKSVCLDLESYLIRLLAGDGKYQVLNRNEGITDADYYQRGEYRRTFERIFDELLADGVFTRTIPQIENSDLFKLSPFKALNSDQAIAVEDILEGLFDDLANSRPSTIVVQGDPGTGKTIVAIYLMKLLRDIQTSAPGEELESESLFSEFFLEGYREQLAGFRVGLVVPQQSLRASIRKVFAKTPSLEPSMVLSPFDVGEHDGRFDLLIVDETHRLNQRANQAAATLNTKFREINERLFGADDDTKTQLDWIRAQSEHQLFLVDSLQSVRPADVPEATLRRLIDDARGVRRHYPLTSQMRVRSGGDFIGYVRGILSPTPPPPQTFEGYDFRFFDDLSEMRDAIRQKDDEVGLARLVAGYAWPWRSRNDADAYDIEVGDVRLRWNSTQTDWINSPGSREEVGSIHTVQGYDLNYAGVIIGGDLRYDTALNRLHIDRANYFDSKGKENNPRLGIRYTDDDLLRYITNIYAVLMTRGMLGTYLYVEDAGLRERVRGLVGV